MIDQVNEVRPDLNSLVKMILSNKMKRIFKQDLMYRIFFINFEKNTRMKLKFITFLNIRDVINEKLYVKFINKSGVLKQYATNR